MSRHLMAKMRGRLASEESVGEQYDWQPGGTAWKHWSEPDEVTGTPAYNSPDEHRSAIVHHNEQRFALEVMPRRYNPGGPINYWTWGIHKHGEDPRVDWTDTDWTAPGNWAEDHQYHPLHPSPAKYMGHADTPEEAMNGAQENWEKHKDHMDSLNPFRAGNDYNINDIMRDHDPRQHPPKIDDDFGDIFGDGL